MKRQIIQGIKKVASGAKNLILRATSESLKPRWLMFGVTDICNSRCSHCDIWRKKPTENLLTPKEIEKMLKDPLFENVEYILNSGGEPTTRQDLEEIFLAEHKALSKARLQLSTNGLLPERVVDIVKFLIKHDINIDVGISIDGVGEKHDIVRGVKGAFEKTDWLLRKLTAMKEQYKNKINVDAGMVLSDFTLSSLQEVREYLQQFNIELNVQWYNEASFYGNLGRNPATNKDNFIKAIESLPSLQIYKMWSKTLKKGKPIKFSCFAGYTFCAIHCNGDISPCLRFWDIKMGNVRENSPTVIWHSPEAQKARKIIKECPGCLNAWGVGWSFSSSFYPTLFFYLRHPRKLIRRLKEK